MFRNLSGNTVVLLEVEDDHSVDKIVTFLASGRLLLNLVGESSLTFFLRKILLPIIKIPPLADPQLAYKCQRKARKYP